MSPALPSLRRIALVLAATLLVALAWSPIADSAATEHSEAGLKRALASYAVARGLNAVISVVQGTEITVGLFGNGAVLALGQVLDPVNDLVEQFASLMLYASIAFGLQVLLIKIGAHWALSVLLTAAALGWAAMAWQPRGPPPWLSRTLVILVLARFAVPLTALASEGVYHGVMASGYLTAQQDIERSTHVLRGFERQLGDEAASADGPAERKKGVLSRMAELRTVVENFQLTAERAVRQMIDLIVVFMIQTVVLPLLFLWLLIGLGRRVVGLAGEPAG